MEWVWKRETDGWVYLRNELTGEEIHIGDRVLTIVEITEGMLDTDYPPDDMAIELGATGEVILIYVPDEHTLDLCVEVCWDNWQAYSREWWVSPEWIEVYRKEVA